MSTMELYHGWTDRQTDGKDSFSLAPPAHRGTRFVFLVSFLLVHDLDTNRKHVHDDDIGFSENESQNDATLYRETQSATA